MTVREAQSSVPGSGKPGDSCFHSTHQALTGETCCVNHSHVPSLFFSIQMTFFEGRMRKELETPDLEAVVCSKQGLQEADDIKV